MWARSKDMVTDSSCIVDQSSTRTGHEAWPVHIFSAPVFMVPGFLATKSWKGSKTFPQFTHRKNLQATTGDSSPTSTPTGGREVVSRSSSWCYHFVWAGLWPNVTGYMLSHCHQTSIQPYSPIEGSSITLLAPGSPSTGAWLGWYNN